MWQFLPFSKQLCNMFFLYRIGAHDRLKKLDFRFYKRILCRAYFLPYFQAGEADNK